jgi:hypothetical protein
MASDIVDRWDEVKDVIEDLYITQGLKLEGDHGVMDTIKREYNIKATSVTSQES